MRVIMNSNSLLVFVICILVLNRAQLRANSKNLPMYVPSTFKGYFKKSIGNTSVDSHNCCVNKNVEDLLDFRITINVHSHKPTSTPEIVKPFSDKRSELNVYKEFPPLANILSKPTSCNISADRAQTKIPHQKILDSKSTLQAVFPCRHYKRETPFYGKKFSLQTNKNGVNLPVNLGESNNPPNERGKVFINRILGTGISEISTSLNSFNNKKPTFRPLNHYSESKQTNVESTIPGFQFHFSPKTLHTFFSNSSNGNNDQRNSIKGNLVRMKSTFDKVMKHFVIPRSKRGSRRDYYTSTESSVFINELHYTPSIYTHTEFSKQTQHEIQFDTNIFPTVNPDDLDSISKRKVNQVSLASKSMQPSSRSLFNSPEVHPILPLNSSLFRTLTASENAKSAMAQDTQPNHNQTNKNLVEDIVEINSSYNESNEILTLATKSFVMQTTQRWHKRTTKTLLHADPSDKVVTFKLRYPVKLWETLRLYDDTYLNMINPHWLEFDRPSPTIHKAFAILYGILMVIGCGGNMLVVFMFVRCRSLRTPPNYLLANLAVSDFFMMAKTPIFILNSLYQGPVLGSFGCKIYGFVGGLTGTASIMTLTSIALDRYYVIVHPLNPIKRTTVTRALLMIAGVWIYAAIFSSLPLFGINNYTSEGYLTSCSFDYLSDNFQNRVFVFTFFVAAWALPLAIISFSYIHIFRIVRAAEKMETFTPGGVRQSGESFKCRHDKDKHRSEVKIALLASIIILLWICSWTPYALVALLGIFGNKQYITPLISAIPALFCKTASCVNPFIYSINHPKFQRELQSKFKLCFRYHRRRQTSLQTSFYSTTYRGNQNSEFLTEMKQKRSFRAGKNIALGKNEELSPESSKTAIGYYVNEHPIPLLHKHPFSPVRINVIPTPNFNHSNKNNSDNSSEYVEIHKVEDREKTSAICTVAQSVVDAQMYVPNVRIEESMNHIFQSYQSQQANGSVTKTRELILFENISEKVKSMQCLKILLDKNITSTKGNKMLRQRANSLPIPF